MRDFVNKLNRLLKITEYSSTHLEISAIDEKSPYYIFSSNPQIGGYIPGEGFGMGFGSSNNGASLGEDGQREVGQRVVKLLNPEATGKDMLDVGCGTNIFVGDGVSQKTDCDVVLLDFNTVSDQIYTDRADRPPRLSERIGEHLYRFQGNFADIDANESQLAGRKFGLITFNGSWSSGGNNWTVTQIIETQLHDSKPGQSISRESAESYHQKELSVLLANAKNHLSSNGTLYISSSRFALHGDGFGFSQLADEKMQFLNAIDILRSLGAKKIKLIGVSGEALNSWLKINLEDPEYKLMRFTETFYEIFHGYAQGPKRALLKKDGSSLSMLEVSNICEDREQMQSIMEQPGQFRDLLLVEVALREEKIRDNIIVMCGGVDKLPDKATSGYLSKKRVAEIKKHCSPIIPNEIARIDAIAVEF